MKISGLQKLTLLDYPEKMATIIFLSGCNFRCPFCHNSELVLTPESSPEIEKNEIISFLIKRKGILDGVVISGGEPLLYEETYDFIREIKDLGYFVKLDTNGSFPERLEKLIDEKLVDYVAMDIKNSKMKYCETIGKENFSVETIEKSVEILLASEIDYEFRTTVSNELHSVEDFYEIGKFINGAKNYYIQNYRDSDGVILRKFTPVKNDVLEEIKAILKPFAANVAIRGMD